MIRFQWSEVTIQILASYKSKALQDEKIENEFNKIAKATV